LVLITGTGGSEKVCNKHAFIVYNKSNVKFPKKYKRETLVNLDSKVRKMHASSSLMLEWLKGQWCERYAC
jgi:hypothetical protein